jgi:hypothetical protein
LEYQYRVTKYNPEYRDSRTGGYLKDEWTAISDVGKEYDGRIFTNEEYDLVEDAYVKAVLSFMDDVGVENLKLVNLWNGNKFQDNKIKIKENESYNCENLSALTRLMLRETIGGKLINKNMFVHFGYDYYMYVGVNKEPNKALKAVRDLGLYAERFASPYNKESEL